MFDALKKRSHRFELVCAECGAIADNPSVRHVYCKCGGIYDIRYLKLSDTVNGLPIASATLTADLGQGKTPLVMLDGLGEEPRGCRASRQVGILFSNRIFQGSW